MMSNSKGKTTSGEYRLARLENRIGDVESDIDGMEQKGDERHQELMSKLNEVQSDVRSNGEEQNRINSRLAEAERVQGEHAKLLYRWSIPISILITIMTAASVASILGVDVAAAL